MAEGSSKDTRKVARPAPVSGANVTRATKRSCTRLVTEGRSARSSRGWARRNHGEPMPSAGLTMGRCGRRPVGPWARRPEDGWLGPRQATFGTVRDSPQAGVDGERQVDIGELVLPAGRGGAEQSRGDHAIVLLGAADQHGLQAFAVVRGEHDLNLAPNPSIGETADRVSGSRACARRRYRASRSSSYRTG